MIFKILKSYIYKNIHRLVKLGCLIFTIMMPQLLVAQNGQIEPVQQMIKVESANLSVDVWGDGIETIIALPGLGSDTTWYHLLAPKITAAGYRLVAVNPRGIRGSEGAIDNLTLDILANDIAQIIKTLDIKQAHLLGWAFGNRIARATAANHPDVVATVTLLAAGGKVPAKPEAQEAMLVLFTNPNLDVETRNKLRTVAFISPKSDAPEILQSTPSKSWPEATQAQFNASRSAPLEAWWGGGNAPMNVIQGLDDITAVPENGYKLKEEFPTRVQTVDIEGAGHVLLIEKPDEVAIAVVNYLSKHPIVDRSKNE